MVKNPKISVIIVNWNVADSLKLCLESVIATKYKNLEIIVIDNNSDTKPKNVTIQNDKNIGFPTAVNQGLKKSTGDYLLVLNPDTRIPKDFFVKALEFAKVHPDMGVMGPKFTDPDGTPQGSVFPEPSVEKTFREFWLGQVGLTAKYSLSKTSEVFAISGACVFFTRKTFEKIGLMTEKVFMYFEDMDYCRRVRSAGLKVYFNPQISIIHEHGQSAKKNPKAGDWRGYLRQSSLWYNSPIKHYLMTTISWTGQKWRRLFSH